MWAPIKCVNHPERDAVGQCDRCRVPICSACAKIYEVPVDPVTIKRKYLCLECHDIRTREDSFKKSIVYFAVVVGFIFVLVFYVSNFVL